MSMKFQSLVMPGAWHINRSCCASTVFVRINPMFELDSYTCSFLFNFEFMFDLEPKLLKFFWIQILNLNSTHPMFLNRIILPFFWFQTMLLSVASLVIFCNAVCSLLLYKRLPSKVTPLRLILNVYFIR